MSDLPLPQPLGAFGFPAGFLLVGTTSAPADEARRTLVAGRVPDPWPDELRGLELAHADDVDGALATFTGADPASRFNRWVLDPACESLAEVRAGLPPALAPMVDVVAHMNGLAGPPTADVTAHPPEVGALMLAAQATVALEHDDAQTAVAFLTEAAALSGEESPALSAVLLGSAGSVLREQGRSDQASAALVEAADRLAATDLADVRAELLHQRGSISHEAAASGRGDASTLLHEAMGYYLDGLKLVTEESAPELWASLNMNLATAHLAVPMVKASDQLRLGVANQALRACRRVYTIETHPGPWSSATLNLANSLVYTPSVHQGDNLVEAVELYEEILTSGIRDRDPVGQARLLSNQGNALAHLGIFDEARPKLVEARYIFEEHLDHDSASSVRSLLDEIAKAEHSGGANTSHEDLARQAEQMARMPTGSGAFTSGMGVTELGGSTAGDQQQPPPKPTVTVLPAGSAPHRPDDRRPDHHDEQGKASS